MTMISRNPFARTELHREITHDTSDCDWCGQVFDRLFRYYTETDGGLTDMHIGKFCSKSCHDSYHS